MKTQIVIVSPALASANNGNWQTARRWQKLLQAPNLSGATSVSFRVRIVTEWPDGPESYKDDGMLALHARRSAPSIANWTAKKGRGLAVVLTGTDLYRDIQTDPLARQSLVLADRLVLLQELGVEALPQNLRAKARTIFQSTPARAPGRKPAGFFKALTVGHLREEKSPETLWAAARQLVVGDRIHLEHIGAGLAPTLAEQACATALACAHYRWLGGLTHPTTLRHIQRAHALVHTSRLEGGAHVVMEAVRCGTPVLGSRIDGNVGMLGPGYAGYFEWGNSAQLVELLKRCRDDRTFYDLLISQCADRAPLFAAETERQLLRELVTGLLT